MEYATPQQAFEASQLLTQIIQSSDDAIISKTLDGVITSWNPAACVIFGYAPGEAVGRHISILIPPDRMAEEDLIISRLKAGLGIDHYETIRLHKNGDPIMISLSVSPIRDSDGVIVGASKIARDITEKKRVGSQLALLQAELAHVGRLSAMGQMSTALAHELNQPLASISSYVKAAQIMLQRDCGASAQADVIGILEKAGGQVARAGMIIRRLRDFVEKREINLHAEDINQIVEEAGALGLIGALESGVETITHFHPMPLPVRVDRIQLQQVILNLIRNGLEAMENSPLRQLTLATAQAGGTAQITVRDTGVGLSADVQSRLFQPFTSTKADGMGIGLTICQSIVEAHGGTIAVLKTEDPGAAFRVTLPLEKP